MLRIIPSSWRRLHPTEQTSAAAYRDVTVLRWLGAYTFSILGDGIYFLALGWATVEAAGPSHVGVVLAIGAVPRAVLMLGGGVLADRFGPKRVMITSDIARSVTVLAAAAVMSWSHLGVWPLVVLAFTFGVADALFMPAVGALPRMITTDDQLARVQGMRNLGLRIAGALGPAAAGFLVAAGGPFGALASSGLIFAVSVVVLAGLRLSRPSEVVDRATSGTWSDLTAGLRYVFTHPLIRPLVLVMTVAELGFIGPFNVGLILVSQERGWNAAGMGLIAAGFGLGATCSALFVTIRVDLRRRGPLCAVGLIAAGALMALLAVVKPLLAAVCVGVTLGVVLGVVGPILAGLVQVVTEPGLLGRVTSVTTLATVGLAPLTYPLTNALIDWIGTVPTFAGFAVVCSGSGLLALTSSAMRRAGMPSAP